MKREIIDASKLELEDKVVAIKRVTKVVKGGRNSRVAALVVVGDRNGHVGVGVGKAVETPEAIRKGKEDAAKHLVTVPVNEVGSIPYDWNGQFGSASVLLKTAPEGTGIIAGGPARSVLELRIKQQAERSSCNNQGPYRDQEPRGYRKTSWKIC